MIAQNPLYPVTLPAPAKQHPDYCELRELLTRLSPAYPVYIHSIARDMRWGHKHTMARIDRLRRDGYAIETGIADEGLAARITWNTWKSKAREVAEQYYDRVYGGAR